MQNKNQDNNNARKMRKQGGGQECAPKRQTALRIKREAKENAE